MSNLLTLCRRHHREVHEGGIRIEATPSGGWRFFRPDGREFDFIYPAEPPTYGGWELERDHAALGLHIDEDTAATRWRGERIDYDHGVWVLCHQKERSRRALNPPDPDHADDADHAPDDDAPDVPAGTFDVSAEALDVAAGTSGVSATGELELPDPSPYNEIAGYPDGPINNADG